MNYDVIRHYDMLIEEGNDPVYDPEELKEYMDKWDGSVFIDELQLSSEKHVFEIGCGSGRLAVRVAPFVKSYTGIDISPKTAERAVKNIIGEKVNIICADFLDYGIVCEFDIVYSSLTFIHIENKPAAINKISGLLRKNGRFVLSIGKNIDEYIDYGTRKIRIYPDTPSNITALINECGMSVAAVNETEFAYIITAIKE